MTNSNPILQPSVITKVGTNARYLTHTRTHRQPVETDQTRKKSPSFSTRYPFWWELSATRRAGNLVVSFPPLFENQAAPQLLWASVPSRRVCCVGEEARYVADCPGRVSWSAHIHGGRADNHCRIDSLPPFFFKWLCVVLDGLHKGKLRKQEIALIFAPFSSSSCLHVNCRCRTGKSLGPNWRRGPFSTCM